METMLRRKQNALGDFEQKASINIEDMYNRYLADFDKQLSGANANRREKLATEQMSIDEFTKVMRSSTAGTGGGLFNWLKNIRNPGAAKGEGIDNLSDNHKELIAAYQNNYSNAPRKIEGFREYDVAQPISEDKSHMGTKIEKGITTLLQSGSATAMTVDGNIVDPSMFQGNKSLKAKITTRTAEGLPVWAVTFDTGDGKKKQHHTEYITIDSNEQYDIIRNYSEKLIRSGHGEEAFSMYFNTLDNGELSRAFDNAELYRIPVGTSRPISVPITVNGVPMEDTRFIVRKNTSEGSFTLSVKTRGGGFQPLTPGGSELVFDNPEQMKAFVGQQIYLENNQ
jgi:hypothetical protein